MIVLRTNKLIIICAILVLGLLGCSNENKNEEIKAADKAPSSANDLTGGIDEILSILGEIERLALDITSPEEEEKPTEEPSTGGESKGSGNGGGEGGSGGQEGDAQGEGSSGESSTQDKEKQDPEKEEQEKEQKKEKELESKWQSINSKIEEIHSHWNELEAEVQKKGAPKEARDKFKDAFNMMTKAIEDQNIVEIYNYASQALLNLKPMYDLYLDDIGGDLTVLRHAAYQGYSKAINGDLSVARSVLSNKEDNLNAIRLKLGDDEKEKEKVEKVNLSLMDFRDSLDQNSRMLFMIKKDIVIENIKALE